MSEVTTIGIDLAKIVLQVDGESTRLARGRQSVLLMYVY